MNSGSRLILIGFLLLVGYLFILALGPIGVLAVPVALIVAGIARLTGGDSEGAPERANCAACGAPNDVDASECRHCGVPLV